MAGGPRRENAVHHVDAQRGVFDDLLRRTYPHQIPRLVVRKVLQRGFHDLAGQLPRLANTEAANGVARESDLYRTLSGLLAKSAVHPTLHDPKQRLCTDRRLRRSRGPKRRAILWVLS